jgi:DNA-binding MarR family transcriptional regulator
MSISPINTVFYNIEKTIKQYRRFAQKRIIKAGYDITIDQLILLKIVADNRHISQKAISKLMYKDFASITRIIELLVKKSYVRREINESDRRRSHLIVTKKGIKQIEEVFKIVEENRKLALKGTSKSSIQNLNTTLNDIFLNCEK